MLLGFGAIAISLNVLKSSIEATDEEGDKDLSEASDSSDSLETNFMWCSK